MAQSNTARAWAAGGSVFAATMMLIIGIFQVFEGIAAIIQGQFYLVTPNYAYEIDVIAWGWIHLGIGALAAFAGFFLFTGATWARVVGITMASFSAIANFFFVPYYPLWSLLIIALNVFAIWAIATVRVSDRMNEVDQTTGAYAGDYPQGEKWPSGNTPTERWTEDQAKDLTGFPTASGLHAANPLSMSGGAARPGETGPPVSKPY